MSETGQVRHNSDDSCNTTGQLEVERLPPGSHVKVPALDGYELGGVHFECTDNCEPMYAVVFAGGGGICAKRYRHFASFLASSGIPVLTFDYRGVGLSRPRSLRGFKATVEDWSELDCGGAIAWMCARYPRAELVGVAHSIGTLALGGAPTIGHVARMILVGAHTGYFGDYAMRHRIPMAVLWHGVMPPLTRMFGYFPARMLGLGEDIPAGVALQWAARRTPGFHLDGTSPDNRRACLLLARYAAIKVPTLAISFDDDAFATAMGTRRLLGCYPGIDARIENIGPDAAGLPKIGHFGFFRPGADEKLWPIVLSYIQSQRPEPCDSLREPPA